MNIEEFDIDDLCMYRCIGDIIDSTEDLMFKVSFLGGEKEDILKIERMIIDFISENCGNDSDSDNDSDNDDDGVTKVIKVMIIKQKPKNKKKR